ncbi:MAG: ATP-binding domain-containing protein [Lachnospiraceae bacterium]
MREEINDSIEMEQNYLEKCIAIIYQNIQRYEEQGHRRFEETQALYKEMHDGNMEVYDQLVTSKDLEIHTKKQLESNFAALRKPYFGRISFDNLTDGWKADLYIGKHGITSGGTQVNVVDWRAPVASVYYENILGRGSYRVLDEEECEIDLQRKRTYDIEDGRLRGMFDSDVVSNDELLIQYLSRHKEAVLHDIIATIQKEQNKIIRANPFHNVIVQGVAGSGKTTVATHRISYILYNYKEKFTSNEFCIIGSTDHLLDYILSGLPELEIYDVKYKRMDELLQYLLNKDWRKNGKIQPITMSQAYKSKIEYSRELEQYLKSIRKNTLPLQSLRDNKLGILINKRTIMDVIRINSDNSVKKLLKDLDDRVKLKFKEVYRGEPEGYRKSISDYKGYYGSLLPTDNIYFIYQKFLEYYGRKTKTDVEETMENIQKNRYDVYDLAALVLIYYRIKQVKKDEEFGQIIVDEAQDFGPTVYYSLKMVLPNCYFTIMGDVSQNINFETGMNNWQVMQDEIFSKDTDEFCVLSKSYRNTIEIAEFANELYKNSIREDYRMDPVIRHGEPVTMLEIISREEGVGVICDLISELKQKEYKTVAVICFQEEEKEFVEKKLVSYIGEEKMLREGIQVLFLPMTKGLEFDVVILWKPDLKKGRLEVKEAKCIYVAATRALHELYVIS